MRKHSLHLAVFLVLFVFCGIGLCRAEGVDFQLPDLSEKVYSLSEYKDKQSVILFFWTTWCPYCQEELMVLKEKYADLLSDGWELFAVNVGESASKVDKFIKKASLPFKVLLDTSTSVAKSFGVFGVPTYCIIGKDGLIKATEHYFPEDAIKEFMPVS